MTRLTRFIDWLCSKRWVQRPLMVPAPRHGPGSEDWNVRFDVYLQNKALRDSDRAFYARVADQTAEMRQRSKRGPDPLVVKQQVLMGDEGSYAWRKGNHEQADVMAEAKALIAGILPPPMPIGLPPIEWRYGPPPSIGWWPVFDFYPNKWQGQMVRWWDGEQWSDAAFESDQPGRAAYAASFVTTPQPTILWADRPASWPERSRI